MAESSNVNPEKNMSFTLNPTNAVKLKQSIEALCDSGFNRQGLGMVEVTEKGFEITVRNAKTHAVGNLFLNSNGLIDFHCNNPIVGKMINLNQISQILNDAAADDTITVFHLDGSTNLSFIFGSAPTEGFKAEFLQLDVEFNKLPDIEFSCETGLESEILRKTIQKLDSRGSELVSVDISVKLVSIFIGQSCPWSFKIKKDDEKFEARVLDEAQAYHAWFDLKHKAAMKKASNVAPRFHLRFLTEPSKNIMMRFKLEEVGDLVFIQKAMLIMKNPLKYRIGPGAPDQAAEFVRLDNDRAALFAHLDTDQDAELARLVNDIRRVQV